MFRVKALRRWVSGSGPFQGKCRLDIHSQEPLTLENEDETFVRNLGQFQDDRNTRLHSMKTASY